MRNGKGHLLQRALRECAESLVLIEVFQHAKERVRIEFDSAKKIKQGRHQQQRVGTGLCAWQWQETTRKNRKVIEGCETKQKNTEEAKKEKPRNHTHTHTHTWAPPDTSTARQAKKPRGRSSRSTTSSMAGALLGNSLPAFSIEHVAQSMSW
eukprot:1160775-Pelagomonas_calceolata.AAC.7